MIGPANPNLPCCHSCGAEGAPESFVLYRLELVCATCYEEHERISAIANTDEFRWMSHEWFRTSRIERLPFNSRAERFY